MRQLLSILVVGAIVSVAFGAAAADREVSIKPVTLPPMSLTLGATQEVDCQVGNLNDPAWAIGNFVYFPEDYAFVFDPMATCPGCNMGFTVSTVRVLLQVTAACQLVLSAGVLQTDMSDPECPAPGYVECEGDLYTVNLPSAGLWNIGLPVTCYSMFDCLLPGQKYLLKIHFHSGNCVPALITDASPQFCRNWNNWGFGWDDLVAEYYPDWPGNLVFFADAHCCSHPISTESSSWGAIKSLFGM